MNEQTVRNWLVKADHDLKTGRDELSTEDPATDSVCFHMQQCVEKCLKAYLVFHGTEIAGTHNIAVLVQNCITLDSTFDALKAAGIDRLTDYAVSVRYPDDFYMPSVEESREAVRLALTAHDFVKARLAPSLP